MEASAVRAFVATLYLLGARGAELTDALAQVLPDEDVGQQDAFLAMLTNDDRDVRLRSAGAVLRGLGRALEARRVKL